ncbi:hypothetical protein BH09MYX1_BH09MYX1_59380 [soil metagenome]
MRTRTSKVLAVALLAGGVALLSGQGTARAADSTKDPLYIQGAVLGYSYGFFSGVGFGAYRLDAEFGAHFTGRHDGFVLGGRQVFYLGFGGSIGATVARVGYDIPIVIKDGKFELTIAPYALVGVAYGLCGTGCYGAGFNFGFGVEAKFFPMQANGFYAFARPIEASFFVGDGGVITTLSPALGVGYAF